MTTAICFFLTSNKKKTKKNTSDNKRKKILQLCDVFQFEIQVNTEQQKKSRKGTIVSSCSLLIAILFNVYVREIVSTSYEQSLNY